MQKSIEVLSNLQGHIEFCINGGVIMSLELAQALKDATEAMKKQVPMAVERHEDKYRGYWKCPICGTDVSERDGRCADRCYRCGQRLEDPYGLKKND